MRLLTHNSLKSPVKNVVKGYPLQLMVSDMELRESDFNAEFIKGVLSTLDWEGIRVAAAAVEFDGVPENFDKSLLADEEFLEAVHRLLLDIHIQEGMLTCPESGKQFPIKNNIPDMTIPENEL